MRLLLDINIFLDIAFARSGQSASTALILECGAKHEAWVAWHTLATLAYLIERQHDVRTARDFITGLLEWAQVAETTQEHARYALALPMRDLEDALQSAAAHACSAHVIITRNGRDFRASPTPALSPEQFLAQV